MLTLPICLLGYNVVEHIGIEPMMPLGTGLQSAHDPYVTNAPMMPGVRVKLTSACLISKSATKVLSGQNY